MFIDWEWGGILPYAASLARLIAHGEEDKDAFFFMTKENKTFALEYYFRHFIKEMGIEYDTYRRTMDLFFFYEHCEWVFVGNKYGATDTDRFRRYFASAKAMAQSILKAHGAGEQVKTANQSRRLPENKSCQ